MTSTVKRFRYRVGDHTFDVNSREELAKEIARRLVTDAVKTCASRELPYTGYRSGVAYVGEIKSIVAQEAIDAAAKQATSASLRKLSKRAASVGVA